MTHETRTATQSPMQSPADAGAATVVVEPAPPRRVVVRRAPDHRHRGIRGIFAFIGWVFTGFGLIPALLRKKHDGRRTPEITVYSAHRAFDLWALILVGFVGGWAVNRWPDPNSKVPLVFGWVYIWVTLYTFITLVFDVGTLKLLLWAGIFTFVWLISRHLEVVKHRQFLTPVFGYLRGLHPRLNHGFAAVMSWLLLVPWIGALFLTFTNGRKKFTPNEISEFQVGEGSELTDRTGLKFRTRYRDVLEAILGFGAGDLVAYDNQHNVIKRWDNVLFLLFLWPKLDQILHERSAIVDNARENPVEVEETRPPAAVR